MRRSGRVVKNRSVQNNAGEPTDGYAEGLGFKTDSRVTRRKRRCGEGPQGLQAKQKCEEPRTDHRVDFLTGDSMENLDTQSRAVSDIVTEDDLSNVELPDLFGLGDLNWTQLQVLESMEEFYSEDKASLRDFGLDTLQYTEDPVGAAVDSSQSQAFKQQREDSPTKEEPSGKTNRNAIAARMNRLKKKEYVQGLESRVARLSTENQELREENTHLNKRVESLEDETRYLRAVLSNDSVLAQLLGRLTGVNGVKLSTSLFRECVESDHDYTRPMRSEMPEGDLGGVCLHVDKNHVSVEFCSKCAHSAGSSFKIFFLGDCSAILGWWELQNTNAKMPQSPCGKRCGGAEETGPAAGILSWFLLKANILSLQTHPLNKRYST
uniref:X-box-binding protein 1 n=1 Tax=Erpetoichthys calabaricus TaxID=27687 RepID=A0A8C4S7Z7_ERPCA